MSTDSSSCKQREDTGMGADKEGSAKGEGEKKADDSSGGSFVAVFKMDMHCEGCAKKVKNAVKHMEGVESVKTSAASNKLTVTGKVDPTQIKSRLEEKTKKKVEIIYPQPQKDSGSGSDNKADEKSDEKPVEEKKAEEKKPPKESTVVLKIRLYCKGSISEIKRVIKEIDRVNSVEVDQTKDLANETMEVKELAPYLKDELKRNVEVVPPKKEEEEKDKGGGRGNKEKRKEGGSAEKKDSEKKEEEKKAEGGEGSETKVEANEIEYAPVASSYWYDPSHGNYSIRGYQGYEMDHYYPHEPQTFSDENPFACSVI